MLDKIYFSGINGIGMSGIAKILKQQGYDVQGSDLEYKDVTKSLEELGIKVHIGQSVENIENFKPDLYVYSTAIRTTNPEYIYADSTNTKMKRRGEILADIVNKFDKSIAIAGTHGKTTTSSMCSISFLSKDPYIVVGGIIPEIQSNSRIGNSDYFIIEADESDNSFLFMNPEYSVITNIDADHLDVHGNLDNIKKSFIEFILHTQKESIICMDSKNLMDAISKLPKEKSVTTYSIKDESANIYTKNIRIVDRKTIFEVYVNKELKGEFSLNIPGEHNIQNSLPVIYLALKFGLNKDEIQEALNQFKGSKRRYDVLYDQELENGYGSKTKRVRIIDDYAHHPTEIKATLKAIKSVDNSRLVAIFQPHRYSRVHFLLNEFKEAFVDVDKLILLPIYAAGEQNEFNISSEILKEHINHNNIEVMTEWKDIKRYVSRVKKDSTYIFMGAGDISTLAHQIAEELEGMSE